jgi:hypothetical protein
LGRAFWGLLGAEADGIVGGVMECNGKEEADPCGMTTRKAEATATAKEQADPCGMTTRKGQATRVRMGYPSISVV